MKNNTMQNQKFPIEAFLCVFCAASFLLIELALTPLYIYVCSDITTSATPIPYVLDIILKLADVTVFAVCYSIIIYGAISLEKKKAMSFFGVYVAATLIRRLLSLGASYLSNGFIDENDIFNVCVYFSLELVQVLAVLVISLIISKKHLLGDVSAQSCELSKAFDKRNPLQISMLSAAIVISAIKILMRIYYDISFGAPDGIDEIFVMLAYYLSDVLVGVVFYVISYFFVSYLQRKYKKTV